jgi:hypothetical protein
MRVNKNIEMIEIVALGLEEILDSVVFVGGAVASLYSDDPGAMHIRPTKDVDCIIEIAGRVEFNKLEDKLRGKGFRHDTRDGAPICRWIYKDVLVDVMPVDETNLGFSNRWYKEGMDHLIRVPLSGGLEISLLSLTFYIATKIEAFHGRKESDFRISHDIEDVIITLDGILNFDEFFNAPDTVRAYLIGQFSAFMKDLTFIESVSSHIDQGQSPARTKRIVDFLKDFCKK